MVRSAGIASLGVLFVACTPTSDGVSRPAAPAEPVVEHPPHRASHTPDIAEPTQRETNVRGDADPDDRCNPFIAPLERRAGNLVVHAPPARPRDPAFLGRLRAHVEGSLTEQAARVWVGPQVPGFLPLTEGTAELFLLEHQGEGEIFVAMYRDPYGASSCDLSSSRNCDFFVKAYDACGSLLWSHRLNDFMSRTTHLELQDLRIVDGTLYFNEACQSYAREANGKCSSLVAVDPVAGTLLWRTAHLVSNNRFLVHGDYIIAGYGFTAERDYLHVVRRQDGKVVHRVQLPAAHENLQLSAEDHVEVAIYPNRKCEYALRNWAGPSPRLELVRDEAPPTKPKPRPPR
jgi:hypothetical protein